PIRSNYSASPIISARRLIEHLRKPDNLLQTTRLRSIVPTTCPWCHSIWIELRTFFVSYLKMPANIRRPDLRFESLLRQAAARFLLALPTAVQELTTSSTR